ncbi:MAG: aldehyde dehydrogenase family protein, partial [Treponema sp.]|nr:aldehyde dehydrogenase family protein [Treponema sp.]
MNAESIRELVEKSRKAQIEWAALPYSERAKMMKKAACYLAENRAQIADTICSETGKLVIDAMAAEVIPAMMAIDYYIKLGKHVTKRQAIHGGNFLMFNKKSALVYKPWGVVGIITPWNYPFSIPFSEVVTALLAGNGVILKTASITPGCGLAIEKIVGAAGLPDGLFINVQMPGNEAGPAFISSGMDKLFFTGSAQTGRQLMSLASSRLLPLSLELGGADAAIIRSDADIDRAVYGVIWAGFSNAGQSCGGIQRVLVHSDIYANFLEKLKQCVESLEPGKGLSGDMGPMISLKQKEEVSRQVNQCIAEGAQFFAQSRKGKTAEGEVYGSMEDSSLYMPALVLTGIKPDMPIMKEEIFGPVIGVIPAANDREALALANDSSYGLTASVWSADHRTAKKIAAEINAGAVMINDHLMSHGLAQTPWGGFGDSGLGKTHGEAGFREMLRT